MKIIQSFALFDEGSPHSKNKNTIHLNLYSFLLSYASLKKHFNHITMYCNQKAYDVFIKYIPYEEIIIYENQNSIDFYNVYKIDILKLIDDECIHIDTDVFLYDNYLQDFINGKGDIIIQNIVPENDNPVATFGHDNKDFLMHHKILTKPYDGRSLNCGILGLRPHVLNKFFRAVDIVYEELKRFNEINLTPLFGQILIIEEVLLYLVAIENNFNVLNIYPYDLILKYGYKNVGNELNYCHLWGESKYNENNIEMIKRKIQLEYPDYYPIVIEHNKRIKNLNIF